MLEKLRKQLEEIKARAKAILESDERSEAAETNLAELLEEGKRVEARIRELVAIEQLESAGSQLDDIISGASKRKHQKQQNERSEESLGQLFVRSDIYKNYPFRGNSGSLEINLHERALPANLAAWQGVLPARSKVDITPPPAPTTLTDLMPTVTVSQNSFETVVYAKIAGGAGTVPEGTAKPSIEFEPTVTPITLDTIAVYTQLTRQLAEDAPAVQSLIESGMTRDIRNVSEANAATALVAATLPTTDAADLLSAIRVGIATVQAAGYNPTIVLLNPADYADLDIAVFTATLNGPTTGQNFWGLRPIASSAQPAGTATVADIVAGVQRYVRTTISLYMTDSHANTFTANILTLLAETREKTVVTRPAAFCECTVTVGP